MYFPSFHYSLWLPLTHYYHWELGPHKSPFHHQLFPTLAADGLDKLKLVSSAQNTFHFKIRNKYFMWHFTYESTTMVDDVVIIKSLVLEFIQARRFWAKMDSVLFSIDESGKILFEGAVNLMEDCLQWRKFTCRPG